MDRQATVAIVKLGACTAVAIALLLVWIFGDDLWYRPIAAAAFIIVAAPVVLLVSIDTGKILRRQRLGRVATVATRIPQYFLGLLAVIGGIVGLGMALLQRSNPQVWSLGLMLFSVLLVLYGIRVLFGSDSNDGKNH